MGGGGVGVGCGGGSDRRRCPDSDNILPMSSTLSYIVISAT